MAHTPKENDDIIPQKPPPPPRREPAEAPIDPNAPTVPADPQRPVQAPFEAPPQQPIAPRVAGASGPGSSRRMASRKPSGHIVVPAPEVDPLIIGRGAQRPRMGSDPALLLIDYPRQHRPSLTHVR